MQMVQVSKQASHRGAPPWVVTHDVLPPITVRGSYDIRADAFCPHSPNEVAYSLRQMRRTNMNSCAQAVPICLWAQMYVIKLST